MPIVGPFLQLAGAAFVERTGDGRDRDVLAEAIDRIQLDGKSLVIAPEGTRSPTPRLGRFKTGAVRIAQQAGVPIVPIVIRNAGALMARSSIAVRPGVVDVVVLEPVDVSDRDPREATDALRELMAAALAA